MRASLRRSLAAASASALLIALTACAGDDEPDATDEPSASTESTGGETDTSDEEETDEPVAEETSEVTEGEEIDPQEFLDRFENGVENSTTAHMTMTTGLSGTTIDAEGDVDYTTDPPSMAITMRAASLGDLDMRFVDGVFYLNMGATTQDKFVKLDPDDPNSPMGDLDELTESMDPVRSFEAFSEGLQKVVYVGEEETESGDDADHYVLTLDTTKVESLEDAGTAGLPKELEYDIWLDDDDRMRQVEIDMGGSGTVSIQVDEWDEPVEIEAPAANEIVETPQG